MKTQLKCISCFIDDAIGGIELIEKDKKVQKKLIKKIISYFDKTSIDYNKTPSFYITRVHRVIKNYYKKDNLFKNIREQCNSVGLKLSKKIKKELGNKTDLKTFKKLIKWAITGNELDFRTVGTGYNLTLEDFYNILNKTFEKPLNIDESNKIYELVKNSKKILYVLDNVGEIAFDKLLIEFFIKMDKKVSVVYRGGAITSDIILEDIKYVGIDKLPVKLVLAGPDTLGISFDEMSKQLKNEINNTDLIISKGQANYYEFSENFNKIKAKIVNLFRTKCNPVSQKFSKKGKIGIAAVLRKDFI